jgi:hypothetical protein
MVQFHFLHIFRLLHSSAAPQLKNVQLFLVEEVKLNGEGIETVEIYAEI